MKKKAISSPRKSRRTALSPGGCKHLGRAAYEERILSTVSRELTAEFGGGFSYATVNRAIQFSQLFPDPAIVSTLSIQLRWSHFSARQIGKQILASVSQELTAGAAIVVTLSRQLSGSRFGAQTGIVALGVA